MIKPYFETELGTLYHGDCLEVMQEFPENHFDLCLTDPQYGLGKIRNYSGQLAKPGDYGDYDWNNKIPSKEYFDLMKMVSENQIIFNLLLF